MSIKIAFMGASVTAQAYSHSDHRLTGYVEAFQQIAKNVFGESYEQKAFAYPGNRFGDAGLLRIHEVIAYKPTICILEPLIEDTTRGIPPSEKAVQYIYACLLRNNILPVTLCLPTLSIRNPRALTSFSLFERVASMLSLESALVEIDMPQGAADAMFRDDYHTNPIGAYYYASVLISYVKNLFDAKGKISGILSKAKANPKVSENLISISSASLHILPFNYRSIRLRCSRKHNPDATSCRVDTISLIQEQTIGPHSPVIETRLRTPFEEVVQKRSVWDPYCHYSRKSYVLLLDRAAAQHSHFCVDIVVSDEIPDYSTSRKSFFFPSESRNLFLSSISRFCLIGSFSYSVEIESFDEFLCISQ